MEAIAVNFSGLDGFGWIVVTDLLPNGQIKDRLESFKQLVGSGRFLSKVKQDALQMACLNRPDGHVAVSVPKGFKTGSIGALSARFERIEGTGVIVILDQPVDRSLARSRLGEVGFQRRVGESLCVSRHKLFGTGEPRQIPSAIPFPTKPPAPLSMAVFE